MVLSNPHSRVVLWGKCAVIQLVFLQHHFFSVCDRQVIPLLKRFHFPLLMRRP